MEMNSTDYLFSIFWKCATVCVLVVGVSISSCVVHQQVIVGEMVKAGANPIEASCAFSKGKPMCVVVAMKRGRD